MGLCSNSLLNNFRDFHIKFTLLIFEKVFFFGVKFFHFIDEKNHKG